MKFRLNTVTYTFIFNICVILLFSFIYSQIAPNNFKAMNKTDTLTYVDYLFYAITIQCGVGLPDITALSNLAKILASIQQVILMGTGFILLSL